VRLTTLPHSLKPGSLNFLEPPRVYSGLYRDCFTSCLSINTQSHDYKYQVLLRNTIDHAITQYVMFVKGEVLKC
jgi:hypothetical protein